jgi:hypothetical protein
VEGSAVRPAALSNSSWETTRLKPFPPHQTAAFFLTLTQQQICGLTSSDNLAATRTRHCETGWARSGRFPGGFERAAGRLHYAPPELRSG